MDVPLAKSPKNDDLRSDSGTNSHDMDVEGDHHQLNENLQFRDNDHKNNFNDHDINSNRKNNGNDNLYSKENEKQKNETGKTLSDQSFGSTQHNRLNKDVEEKPMNGHQQHQQHQQYQDNRDNRDHRDHRGNDQLIYSQPKHNRSYSSHNDGNNAQHKKKENHFMTKLEPWSPSSSSSLSSSFSSSSSSSSSSSGIPNYQTDLNMPSYYANLIKIHRQNIEKERLVVEENFNALQKEKAMLKTQIALLSEAITRDKEALRENLQYQQASSRI
eukprot:Awhi_evm1s3607